MLDRSGIKERVRWFAFGPDLVKREVLARLGIVTPLTGSGPSIACM